MSAGQVKEREEQVVELRLALIERGYYQPRELFEPQLMEATRQSILEKGQKYPVIVRPIRPGNPLFNADWSEEHYELADGERRTRCCRELGFENIKAIVRNLSDEEMLDYTVTTTDAVPLNPIEKAKAFYRLSAEFGKSQAEIARSFHLKQQQVSEFIRLLELPPEIQDLTARSVISLRHARELLKLPGQEERRRLCEEILDSRLSTREVARQVKRFNRTATREAVTQDDLILGGPEPAAANTRNTLLQDVQEVIRQQTSVPAPPALARKAPKKRATALGMLIEMFSQANALLITGKPRLWLKARLANRFPGLAPEKYLAWVEISILIPCLALYALERFFPPAALALGCVAWSILLLHVFEANENPQD